MNHRLQVRISIELNAQIEKAAEQSRMSKGEWVRRALKGATRSGAFADPVAQMASLNAPVANIERMLAEIGESRSFWDDSERCSGVNQNA
jgi:hypothetical protein